MDNYITVIEDIPIAEFDGTPTTGDAPLMVSFTDLSTGTIGLWNWDFGDDNTSTEQNPSHEYLTPGNFTVSLEVIGPGGSSTEVKTDYILIPVGIEDNTNQTIIVYPNPVKDVLTIKFPDSELRTLLVKNLSGKIVKNIITDAKQTSINVTNLSSGVYTLEIISSNANSTIKVVVN